MIGNVRGLPITGFGGSKLADISADGANTITLDSIRRITVGDFIDILNKATGAVLASHRQVTNLTSAGVLTYGGADVAAVPGTHAVYRDGAGAPTGGVSISGGPTPQAGFNMDLGSIDSLRARLTEINATTYSAAQLDIMTENDMVYAIRVNDELESIKQ